MLLWVQSVQGAPEELECPIPVAHQPVPTFAETSYEEALQSYMGMLEDHAGEHMNDCKAIRDILGSEEATSRLVYSEWKVIEGSEQLEFQWKPSVLRGPPSKVGAYRFEAMGDSWERVRAFMWEQLSAVCSVLGLSVSLSLGTRRRGPTTMFKPSRR